jgi:hypothetical protein
MIKIDITQLNKRLGNKTEAYADASTIYYLPEINSKAITVDYLSKYYFLNEDDPSILVITSKDLIMNEIPPLREELSVPVLLEKLDDILLQLNKQKTGLTYLTLPNEEWVLRAILFVDPDNKFKVFGKKIPLEATIFREINPK